MKISSRLTIAVLIPLFMTVVLSIIAFTMFRQVKSAQQQSARAVDIADSIAELNLLWGSYLLNPRERSREQFLLEHDVLSELLEGMEVEGKEETAFLDNIYKNSTYMREVFTVMVGLREKARSRDPILNRLTQARMTGQLKAYSRGLSTSASRLVTQINQRTASAQNRANAIVILITLSIALLLTGILMRLLERINSAIAGLRRATEVIGSGNLDYRVGTLESDELGQFSHSFNRMTEQLKKITVSRDALAHEVAERKQAEDRLKLAKEFSDALNETDIIIHSPLEGDVIMERVVVDGAQVIGAEGSLIGLFEGDHLSIRHAHNLPLEKREYNREELRGIWHAALTKETGRFDHSCAEDQLASSDSDGIPGMRSALYAPLIVRNNAIGVIAFYTSVRFAFSEMHQDFARKLAASLSLALDRVRLYEEIRHLAHHDALTGLPNRKFLMDLLHIEMAQARRNKKKMALLFLDLDRFKYINDTLGHDVGDKLIREVAERLKQTVRASDTVARFGGDEFNILMADIGHSDDVITIAQKIIAQFRTPYRIGSHELYTTTSIGISICPDDGEKIETLMKNADIAMYHAKELGGNTYQFYSSSMNIRTIERIKMEEALRQSLERGEMVVYYQPQLDLETRKVISAEALVRWRHPELGLLSPMRFISIAEETGFVASIDEWVLHEVCRQIKEWSETGLPAMSVTVNLSSKLFQNPELAQIITEILKETGASSSNLEIEIPERLAMSNIERTELRLKELSDMGIHISIDDFGTGYSSLVHLKRLPVTKLKIDESFIQDIATDPENREVIGAMTAMAHRMKIKVIAEGVETEDQLSFLHRIHCDEAQGYLFSRPLPAEEFSGSFGKQA